jgi:hypothetical protein
MEAHMKFTIPGILITALIAGSPAALAQGMNYSGSSSNPATSVSKDETTGMTKRTKKHMVSHKHRHHAKAVSSKAQGDELQARNDRLGQQQSNAREG